MLRQELLPPTLSIEMVSYLENLAIEIIERLDSNTDYLVQIAEFNHLTDKIFDISDFDGAAGYSVREFVESALLPTAKKVENITDEEILEMLKLFRQSNPINYEWNFFHNMLAVNIPNLNIVKVIEQIGNDATEKEILTEARKWKPIPMPPSSIIE